MAKVVLSAEEAGYLGSIAFGRYDRRRAGANGPMAVISQHGHYWDVQRQGMQVACKGCLRNASVTDENQHDIIGVFDTTLQAGTALLLSMAHSDDCMTKLHLVSLLLEKRAAQVQD